MAWNNIPNRATGDTILAADANALMENLRVLGGNGTATPSSDIQTLESAKLDIADLDDTPADDANTAVTSKWIFDNLDALTPKQYVDGTAYTNGTPSMTSNLGGNAFTVTRGVYMPYATRSGDWRLRFNVRGTFAAGVTNGQTVLSGVTFKNVANYAQALHVMAVGSAPYTASGAVGAGTSLFDMHSAASSTEWRFSGDVELNAKPTWAD